MTHYHIRWSNTKLDWEPFKTEAEAQIRAKELVRPGETYTIEQLDGDCPQCATQFAAMGSADTPGNYSKMGTDPGDAPERRSRQVVGRALINARALQHVV